MLRLHLWQGVDVGIVHLLHVHLITTNVHLFVIAISQHRGQGWDSS